ncbi:hypothetical protein BO221_39485 [Archangium sp. Cb G35]|uniref:hypothetical protein n=1 Tax=Archangium sp. Cb G35 TaxID=1920190 RepID=UPI000936A91C|nr:hypothetical protein [Archangium sp. Cb G35]OJT18809.1 hypothetical protein BO221_39485 [Archangium sp. Cb G35]
MRRPVRHPAQRKIAFFVDGDKEKLLVEALARKVMERHRPASQPVLATLRLAGTPREGLFSLVEVMLTKDYQRFLILFNTGSTSRRRIAYMASEIHEPMVRARLEDKVSIIPLVPSIESWVLADEEALARAAGRRWTGDVPHERGRPEDVLRELLGGWGPREQKRVARHLDPERMRGKDKSFDAFVRALQLALGAGHRPVPEERDSAVT